jgi:GPH family glycoside/pentoside/hexuronide:cation symporter
MNGGITKLAFSAQGVLFASIMSAAGYAAGQTVQTASAVNGIRFMIGGTTMIASLITAYCMWRYPLGRSSQTVVTATASD